MAQLTETLVFDTGPLSHFAKHGWLGVLRLVAGDRSVVIPEPVAEELELGVHRHPYLRLVLDAPWIQQRQLASVAELDAYHVFENFMLVGERNRGECAVLASPKQMARRLSSTTAMRAKWLAATECPISGRSSSCVTPCTTDC
ncbi:hypothetical protein GCM10029964_105600 [Kibdelosporangium lantanae]